MEVSLEEFTAEAEAWFEENAERRPRGPADEEPSGGTGAFSVAVSSGVWLTGGGVLGCSSFSPWLLDTSSSTSSSLMSCRAVRLSGCQAVS